MIAAQPPSLGRRNTWSPERTCTIAPRTAAAACCTRWKRDGLPRRRSQGAASTSASTTTGASVAITSASSPPRKMPTVANITEPSTVSARMLRSVWETIVPSTTGKRSRMRPVRRATISAREGSPSRAGSVADISTPIIVPRAVSRRRTRSPGRAARRIACQASARSNMEPHISAKATRTQIGEAARTGRLGVLRLQRGQPRGPNASAGRRGAEPRTRDNPGGAALRLRPLQGLLVDLGDLARHLRPGEALGALAGGAGHALAPAPVERKVAQRLAELDSITGRHEQAVQAVAHHVAIARDVRGDHRRARRERLRQDHAEALATERGGAEHVGLAKEAPLLLLGHTAGDLHALRVEQERGDLLVGCAGDGQLRLHAGELQRLEGAQEHGQALAALGAADEQDAGRPAARPRMVGPGGAEVHAVWHDAVEPAVEAARGPFGGLGHRDARAQLRVEAPRA